MYPLHGAVALHLRFSFPTPPVEIFAAGNCLFRLRPRPRPRREEITPIFLPLSVTTVTARARGERYCSDNGFCREITEKESFRSLRRCLALSRLSAFPAFFARFPRQCSPELIIELVRLLRNGTDRRSSHFLPSVLMPMSFGVTHRQLRRSLSRRTL